MAVDTPLLTNYEEEKSASFVREFCPESKRLWKIAGPAIFTSICQYSLGAFTQTFAGQIGELELAAVSVENSVIAGLAFGVMVTTSIFNFIWLLLKIQSFTNYYLQLGMGSALETLCGQAFGAGEIRMLGVYMQRSWIILLTTAFCLLPIYIWSPPILHFFGESDEISRAAGQFFFLFRVIHGYTLLTI
ncbi:Protein DETOXIFICATION [Quillaja saponaria]|uniref:Protein DETOXIFICATION n=1 Tax=Quillaja saponaria TaxID=32244 RepID=A0AAD7LYJ4_QUISA|nr:Protein DETOXIFICATION [Quillaja saponaria]